MAREIIYQVLPRIWGNGKFSDWDGPVFDYLHSLGITAIWFTGIPRHASGKDFVKGNPGSPYAVSDWFDVNPYLADKEEDRMREFEQLVRRTHKAGFKFIMDFVPNHVAKDNGQLPVFDHCDYDWTDTLKVNYGHPDTYPRMLEILRFWAAKGVDGFRCDMVEMVPCGFFAGIIPELKRDYPEIIFIGEAYNKDNYRPLIDAGFDLLYDKSGSYDILRDILCSGASARQLTWNWQWLSDIQPHMLNFLENHDEQRLASPYFAGSAQKGIAAFAFSALFNTASLMLYAGQELGESAAEGAEGRTSIFDWCSPLSLRHLHAFIHSRKPLPSAEAATLERYRQILTIASSSLCNEGSNYDLCWCNGPEQGFDPDRHFAFVRYSKGRAMLVFCNFSDSPAAVRLYLPEYLCSQLNAALLSADAVNDNAAAFEGHSIEIQAGAWDAATLEITS